MQTLCITRKMTGAWRAALASIGLELRDSATKGCGVYALAAFAAGQRLLAEEPLVECEACDAKGTVYPAAAVDALGETVREAFFALCQNAQWGADKSARGIWLSNALPTDDVPAPKSAVFRYTCRFNHACRPNVYQHWNERLRAMMLHAIRPIHSGEELTISYLPFGDGASRSSRQASLLGDFGFQCGCDLCALQGDALKQSDARQERIQALGRRLQMPDAGAVVDLAEGRLRLLRKEGMLETSWDTMFAASTALRKAGKQQRPAAIEWAARAAECARVALGEDSREFEEYSAAARVSAKQSAARPNG